MKLSSRSTGPAGSVRATIVAFSVGAVALTFGLSACTRGPDADAVAKAEPALTQQVVLGEQLAAEKDSLTRIVLETDRFLAAMDSQIARAPGMKKGVKVVTPPEGPFADQLKQRQELLQRVQQLVDRSRTTSQQLAKARTKVNSLETAATVRAAQNDSIITELGATVERQLATIGSLQSKVDSLYMTTKKLEVDTTNLRGEVRGLGEAQAKAWVVIGTERELLDKGLIVREGGTSLLIARVGRTLVPARDLKQDFFTPIDIRKVNTITVPDSTKRYDIISRQSLDFATVADRKGNGFRGSIVVTDPGKFWANSHYLILVQQ
jgi:hypothetical protein